MAWSLSANPTISDSVATDTATSTGAYAVNLNNLNASTLYHFRAFATSCGGTAYGSDLTFTTNAAATVIFLTTTGANTWSVPSDWNSSANSIEIVGGGASAGGGGGYAKATNVSLTPGGTVGYQISPGGATTTGGSGGISAGDTYFCNSTSNCASIGDTAVKVGAKGGLTASNGGAASSAIGGAGGGMLNPGGPYAYSGGASNGGGGGAAGPNGNGVNSSGTSGGSGDNGYGSAGAAPGIAVAVGTEWDSTHGSGGGSGGQNGVTKAGGLYGGGSAGSGLSTTGAGGQGLIVISYTPSAGGGGGGDSTPAPKFQIIGGFFRLQGGNVRIQ